MSCDYSKPHQETLKTGYTSLLCVKKDGKFGFVNELGEEVIPCKFDQVSYFSEGWAALKKGKKWAYYDAHGRKVLDLKKRFTYCGPFHDGVAFVSTLPTKDAPHNYAAFYEDLCKELQFINTKGEVVFNIKDQWGVVKCSHVVKLGFSEGLLKLRSDSSDQTMIGFLDKSGQLKIPFTSQNQSSISGTFSNGLVVAGKKSADPSEKNRKYYGYMDQSGEWVIPPKYAKALPYNHGVAVVWEQIPKRQYSYKTYLIDKKGSKVFPAEIGTNENLVRDSLLAVYRPRLNEDGIEVFGSYGKSRRYALAKIDGTLITDYIYANLSPGKTSKELWQASLPEDKAIGFLNNEGQVVIPFQFPSVSNYFEDGLAVVKIEGQGDAMAVIDAKGDFVLPPNRNANYQISGEIMNLKESGGFTYYNRYGQAIDLEDYEFAGVFQRLYLGEE